MAKPPKRWTVRNSMMLGAAIGILATLFHLDDYQGSGAGRIVGGFFGAVVSGAFMFGLVAGLRNRLIFGKQP